MNRKILPVLSSAAASTATATANVASSASSLFRPFSNHNRPLLSSSTTSEVPTAKILCWRFQILDPDSEAVSHWNYVFLATCIIALLLDPLYFFLPSVNREEACLETDGNTGFLITVFRTVADLFFVFNIFMKFRTAFVSPSSRSFGRGELVMDEREIRSRYFKTDFVIDLAAALPLPQFVVFLIIPSMRDSKADYNNSSLALVILLQYIPRLFVIFPLNGRIIKTTGVVAKADWAGAGYNLVLFLLSSHVLGATWYLVAVGRQFSCWKDRCNWENRHRALCLPYFLDCSTLEEPDRLNWRNVTTVIDDCDAVREAQIDFKFGIFAECFTDDVAASHFYRKILYCLWWGLRTLSSYAQELDTSIYVEENLLAIFICILGSVLFALLIGNMQTYFQSMSVRIEEWRIKRRDTEEWMRHRQLPPDLQERVHQFVQYKWLATRGVNEESILRSLPVDLRREIQRHLCIALVRRVPFFSQMDDQLLDAICQRLVSSLSIKGTYIVREGDPVNEMLFIIRGTLESSTTNGGRDGFFNSITLQPGDFCGEELLTWALTPNSTLNLPSSTRTVRAVTEVEAFALEAEDLKFVAHQFKRLHSKKLQHAFRYYSHQWRTWASCFIQSAWRKFRKRKMAMDLSIKESGYGYVTIPDNDSYYSFDAPAGNYADASARKSASHKHSSSKNLGATILASKFAKNTRKVAGQKPQPVEESSASSSLQMPPLLKPSDPDFYVENELV
ncbi:hypothetical protein AB3S75_010328 [Citrus x aurantiifolia]